VAVEANTTPVTFAEGLLKDEEEAAGAWEPRSHGSELPQNLVPSTNGEALAGRLDHIQEGIQAFAPVGRKGEGASNGIKIPAQESFLGAPKRVTLLQLLDGSGFLPHRGVVKLERSKHVVNGMKCGPKETALVPLGLGHK
jgi:hypothetical protein